MKHTYHIHGMTCNGCRTHVEETLSKVEGVSKVTVDLEKAEATIEMESHIPIEKFQEALKPMVNNIAFIKMGNIIIPSMRKKLRNPRVKGRGRSIARCIAKVTKLMISQATVPFAEWTWSKK